MTIDPTSGDMLGAIDKALAAAHALLRAKPRSESLPFVVRAMQVRTLTRKALASLADRGVLAAPETAAAARDLDDALHACYVFLGQEMLADRELLARLPDTLMQASAGAFRELAGLHACLGAATPRQGAAKTRPAWHTARALWCLGMHAKWTYFEHRTSDGRLWRALHGLYLEAEAGGIADEAVPLYEHPDPLTLSCADLYVQSLLLGMLNAGNLTPAQIELAHRWVTAFVRGMRVAPNAEGAKHAFQVRLDSDHGVVARPLGDGSTDKLRFVDIEPVCAKLLQSRASLRHGHIDLGPLHAEAVVLDYGAFLDLAERFWSPELQRVHDRAPRVKAADEPIEAIAGFAGVIAVCEKAAPPGADNVALLRPASAGAPGATLQWTLKDRSDTGIGVHVPFAAAGALTVGMLVAFRPLRSPQWEIGTLVRRLDNAEQGWALLGVKRITNHPVPVTLRPWHSTAHHVAQAPRALFAPVGIGPSRVDSLVVDVACYTRGGDFILPVGDVGYRLRLNRVLDRGDDWVRAGFEVRARHAMQDDAQCAAAQS